MIPLILKITKDNKLLNIFDDLHKLLFSRAGNHWDCSSDLGWLSKKDRIEAQRVQDKDKMICADEKYKDKPLVRILDYIQVNIS